MILRRPIFSCTKFLTEAWSDTKADIIPAWRAKYPNGLCTTISIVSSFHDDKDDEAPDDRSWYRRTCLDNGIYLVITQHQHHKHGSNGRSIAAEAMDNCHIEGSFQTTRKPSFAYNSKLAGIVFIPSMSDWVDWRFIHVPIHDVEPIEVLHRSLTHYDRYLSHDHWFLLEWHRGRRLMKTCCCLTDEFHDLPDWRYGWP